MWSTADLPDAVRLDPVDAAVIAAVRASGLILTAPCRHLRVDCPACIGVAAARIVEAEPPKPLVPTR